MDKYHINQGTPEDYVEMAEGVYRRTLGYGEKTLIAQFKVEEGKEIPLHRHPYEQTGYLLAGRVLFNFDGEEHELGPGDSWVIAEDVLHGMKVLEETLVIEVFSPPREDYKS